MSRLGSPSVSAAMLGSRIAGSLNAYANSFGSGNRGRFAAGVEGSFIFKPVSNVAIKLFGGATHDDHVAGIAAQNYTGVLFVNIRPHPSESRPRARSATTPGSASW